MRPESLPPLEFPFPIPRTHCGVALGNGSFGVLVWGSDKIHLTVSRNDFWDRRHGVLVPEGVDYRKLVALNDPKDPEKLKSALRDPHSSPKPFSSTLLPGGRFDLVLAPGLHPTLARLLLAEGILEVRIANAGGEIGSLLFMLSVCADALHIQDEHGYVSSVVAHPAWEWVSGDLAKRGFAPPERIGSPEVTGWFQACPEDPGLLATTRAVPGGRFVQLSLAKDLAIGMNEHSSCWDAFRSERIEIHRERHLTWWAAYWSGVPGIEIPDDFFRRFYAYAQYKFACATHPHAPVPAPLQGPWLEEYQMPPWGGDYTMNVNIQQIYTLAFRSGNLDHLMPLFNMLDGAPCQEAMRQNALRLYRAKDGLALTHSVNDLGRQCQGQLRPHSGLDQSVTGWLAQLYWEYYRHSLDEDFLRDRAWPFMNGAMTVYEAMLEEHDGRLSLPLGPSPEFGAHHDEAEAGRDASWQLACIHMLAEALLKASAVLGLPPKPAWREIQERLPAYATVPVPAPAYRPPGDYGRRIGLWEGLDLPESYRHHSHLGGVYPFDTLQRDEPEHAAILENTIDGWVEKSIGMWSEWCMPWAVIIQTRVGMNESPRLLLGIWKELFINEGWATVYIPRFTGISSHRRELQEKPKASTEIMQLDGTMAGATALLEMLVHERRGVIHLFAGIPERWSEVSFEDVWLPGGFRMSAERKAGRIRRVSVFSEQGGELKIALAGRVEAFKFQASERRSVVE